MKLTNILRLAVLNVSQKKARLILTSIGITISVSMMFLLTSISGGIQNSILKTIKDNSGMISIDVMALKDNKSNNLFEPGNLRDVTEEEITKMSKIENVKGVYPVYYASAEISIGDKKSLASFQGMPASAVNKEANGNLAAGSYYTNDGSMDIVLDSKTVSDLNFSPSDIIGKEVTLLPVDMGNPDTQKQESTKFKVIGVNKYRLLDGSVSYLPQTTAKSIYEKLPKPPEMAQIAIPVRVYVRDFSKIKETQKEIEAIGLKASTPIDIVDTINNVFGYIRLGLMIFSGIALLVALLGITNFTMISVYERMKEIGVLRSLGFSERDVVTLFLIESGYIGLMAGAAGIIVGLVLGLGFGALSTSLLHGFSSSYNNITIKPDINVIWILIILGFSSILSMIAAAYPAYFASRQEPAKILRSE